MTAKKAADEVDEVEAVQAEAEARPAKRKRRVRVIEVIDDEDLDEVLEAIDAEDAEDDEDADEDEQEEAPRPVRTKKTTAAGTAAPKPRPKSIEPPDEEGDEAEEPELEVKPVRKSRAESPRTVPATLFGLGRTQAIVVVVLVALLATLAIWQWRSASDLSAEQDDREAVAKVASAYGDVALNYNASNYQTQMDKAQKLMGGDLLESFKTTTLPNLGNTFKSNPDVSLSSKSNQVFVGSVDGRFATAVVMVDVDVRTKDGTTASPATLIRLALAKIKGDWKVTKQYASGTNDQNQQSQQNQVSTTPSGSPSPSPSGKSSDKPKN